MTKPKRIKKALVSRSFRFDEIVVRGLEAACIELKMTASDFVREAIAEKLKRVAQEEVRP